MKRLICTLPEPIVAAPSATRNVFVSASQRGHGMCSVTFARADIEADMAADPSLPSVGWTWLTDALQAHEAEFHAFSGSVTIVHTEGFGEMASDGADAQIELRASWTPGGGVGAHVTAWSDLLCTLAGLPPVAPGVIQLPHRRSRGS